jgi:hypothetical protein
LTAAGGTATDNGEAGTLYDEQIFPQVFVPFDFGSNIELGRNVEIR